MSPPPSTNLIARLSRQDNLEIEAARAEFLADFLPRMERSGDDLQRCVSLARELAGHHLSLIALAVLPLCSSFDEFDAALWDEIPRYATFLIGKYPWLKNEEDGNAPMLEEIEAGFTFFRLRMNPWSGLTPEERKAGWHVGMLTGECLWHTALKLRAEGLSFAAAGGLNGDDPAQDSAISDSPNPFSVEPHAGDRKALYHECRLRLAKRGVRLTYETLAAEANRKWTTGTNVKWWIKNDARSQPVHDDLIRRAIDRLNSTQTQN